MNDSETIFYILQRIEERFHTSDYEPRKCNETQIKITVNCLRTDYLMHVINLCPSLSVEAVQLRYLHTRNAQVVASKFLSMWKANLHLQTGLLPSYVTSHRDNDETLQSITDKHLLITQRLMKLLDQATAVWLHLPLIHLSSLAYWLVLHHSSIKNSPQPYDLYLHQFLSDLVVVFLLLLSELFPQAIPLDSEADLPGIEKCYIGLKDPTFVNMNAPECKKKIICYIKQRLATFDYETWGIGDTHIDTVITLYLLNETYKYNVASFMDLSTDPETSDLQQLNEEDAEELVIDLSLIWMETLNILSGSQAKNDIEQLINLIRCPRSFYIPVIQQLSLAYWLLLCYNENGSGDSLYLCDLLNDLIVMFILLLSKLFPSQHFFKLHGDLWHYTRSDYITKDKRPSYIQQSVRQRLEAFDLTYSDAQVMTVVTVYLLSNSYKCHVANVCQNLPIEAIDLTRLRTTDAIKIADQFKSIWKDQISHEVELDYVIIQKKSKAYTTRLESYTHSHINATEQLMELLKQQEKQMYLYVPLQQLLSLAYWLVQYYHGTKRQDRYNKHLHHFLSDFVVIFILLLSELYPKNYFFASCNLCDLPGIVQTTVRITDFAENSVFRELVLLEICKILRIPMNTKCRIHTLAESIHTLAESIHQHLMNTCKIKYIRWNSRDTQFLCKIIADQARYMTPNKNRNTVAHKNIANIVKFSQVQMGDILLRENPQEIRQLSETIMQHRLQNPTNLVALSEMTDTQLNHFYHMAFVGIIWYTDNDCPQINNKGWIAEVEKFINYSQELAQRVIQTAAEMNHNSRSFIAKVTKVLGEIIATRSWLNLEHHKKGIISNFDHKSHRDVLIHFIAFRVLLLYLLPKNLSQYGESDIARHLPQYARNNFIFI